MTQNGPSQPTGNAVKREAREHEISPSEIALTGAEREAVAENSSLSSLTVYSIIMREGLEELERPLLSLWWSGIAAGIGISSSVLAEAVIRSNIGSDHPYLSLVESLGYTFGFVLVILARLQLFTENTITVILPLLANTTKRHLASTARLWAVVLAANFVGTFFTAAMVVHGGILTEDIFSAILQISRHVAELSPSESLLRGIPAGFFIAALVWMLPSAKGSSLMLIVMFTWLIAAGEFTHVIAGSNEIFTLVLNGELHFIAALSLHIGPMLLGNIIGGTGLFAMLAYGQIRQEM
ncbi:formate/nitrite transporter family protein [Shewanella saliphila]|uniref:Formate dehydrogenase n=1 Tax=Shewanella saliphila TaxID=2282698 RepID=A0ABQ2Q554_9GAMM|nr:formate/nitrite transporter family protein [Shewanella saliphila]MCL1101629.1 formate/nitrite transporter family protein [Shewanella saliphila]GGP51564.1 formate dehydrogenase [Shewanella saliphila]